MLGRRLLVVPALMLAVVGCGEDQSDVPGALTASDGLFFPEQASDEAASLRVLPVPSDEAIEEADGSAGDHGAGDAVGDHEASSDDVGDHDASSDHANHDESSDDADHDASSDDADRDGNRDPADHDGDHDGDGNGDAVETATEASAHEANDVPDAAVAGAAVAAGGDNGSAPAADEGAAEEPPQDDVVNVEMTDFAYVLDRSTVPVGEPVNFRFVNTGLIEHEAMFGTAHQQEEFASSDDHGDHGDAGHHGEVVALTLDPDKSGELTMVFDAPGDVMIGCHLPGHWDAGMFTTITAQAA